MQEVTVELPEELVEKVDYLSEETGLTRSHVARELIAVWLDKQ